MSRRKHTRPIPSLAPSVKHEEPVETVVPIHPSHWIKGELLNVQGFQDGSYQVTRMGESYQRGRGMEFDSSFAANQFLAWWYARESADPRAR